ncbi:MAG: alpha-N-arabinofuranosidase [Clostridiales Family XIII bacterium]|jgi:alpha-N-arabinofuranosidase|nr:alpha-N-arabinofuranosidase [Clostridiales Family XIII bacterium]
MKTRIRIDVGAVISPIDDRIYGSFIEHMGRAIYTGIFEPGHETADEYGFRRDVMDLIRPLGLAQIRYPGGNFLSGYNWRDGVGPRGGRPVRMDAAWFALEPNLVGTDEFLQYCERLGTTAMMGVNLGTGSPAEAAALLEYVNGVLPTAYADMRRANGRELPYGVKLWCLGNEMDGPWQICAKTAEEYSRAACETAKLMKWIDPDIELVACGSSYRAMPTYGDWEKEVLRHCYPHIDYLSLHQYYENNDDDIPAFLARSIEMEEFIREVAGYCAEAKKGQSADNDVYLSFDEWNVWYHFRKSGKEPPLWTVGRPIEEETYDGADALLVGLMLNTLMRNSDVVKIACLAQLVNVIAPIMTEPGGGVRVQPIYHPFLHASRHGRGEALRSDVTGDTYDCAVRRDVPYVDCAAVRHADGEIVLFLINRDMANGHPCDIQIAGQTPDAAVRAEIIEWLSMTGSGSANGQPEQMDTRLSQSGSQPNGNGMLTITLPAFSWNMLRLASSK